MSILASVETALSGVGFAVGEGKYPDTAGDCGKVIFTGKDKPISFMGGGQADIETFKVIVRGDSYRALEQSAGLVKAALTSVGFIQTGGYEYVEPKYGETYMELAVSFKIIR
jgi:hypothetical protein